MAHILVPFSDTEYSFYKSFIRGDDKPNVFYAEDVLKEPSLIAKFSQVALHYIYLGETFLQAKRNQLSEEQLKEIKNRQQ